MHCELRGHPGNDSPSLLRQGGSHFAGDSFRCIFVNEKIFILIKVSMKFAPKGPIDNNPNLDNGLTPNRRQVDIWINAVPIHRRIYTALGWYE